MNCAKAKLSWKTIEALRRELRQMERSVNPEVVRMALNIYRRYPELLEQKRESPAKESARKEA